MTEIERLEQQAITACKELEVARERAHSAKRELIRAKRPEGIMAPHEDVALEIKERLEHFKSETVRRVLKALADSLDRTDVMAIAKLDDQMSRE